MRKWWVISIIVVLLAVAGGFFYINSIDWNEHKNRIAAEISQKTGKTVIINGPLSLSVFPSPNLMVQDVKVYSQDKKIAEPLASAEKIVARLDLLPFIKGEFKVTRMSMTNPVLRVEVFEDGGINWKSDMSSQQKQELLDMQVTLDSVTLENAEIDYINQVRDIEWKFTNLNAEVMAPTLLGPYKIDGSFIKNNMPEGFSIEMGQFSEDFPVMLNFAFNNPQLSTIYRFDGTVLFKNESFKGSLVFDTQKLADYVSVNSKNIQIDKKYDQPLSFTTAVSLDKEKLEFSDLVMKYGQTTAAGNIIIPRLQEVTDWAQKDKEERRKIEMAFNMTDADLDLAMTFLKEKAGVYFDGKAFEADWAWDVIADIKAVKGTYAQQSIKNLDLSFDIVPGKIEVNKLEMILPGETAFKARGKIFSDNNKHMMYQFETGAATEDLEATLVWLGLKPEVKTASTYKKFSGTAVVAGNGSQIKISPFEVSFDNSQIKGSLGRAEKNGRSQIFAILETDSFSFDNYVAPLPKDLETAAVDVKLKHLLDRLAAYQGYEVRFMGKAGLLIYGGVPMENVQFNGDLIGGTLNVRKLSIGNVLNSKLNLDGKISGFGGPTLNLEGVVFDFETQRLASPLNKLDLNIQGLNPEVVKNLAMRGNVIGNLDQFVLKNNFKIGKTEGSFNGSVNRRDLQKLFKGELVLKNPDFVQMLNDWGINYKPNVYSLGVFSLNSQVELGQKRWQFVQGTAAIGQDVFKGNVVYDNQQGRPKITGNLNINQLEFERYFYGSNVKVQGDKLNFLKNNSANAAFWQKPSSNTNKIDYVFYNRFDLNMPIVVEKFIYAKTNFDNLSMQMLFDMGNLNFNNVKTLYKNANINGSVKLATATTPTISANLNFADLSMDEVGVVGQKYGFEDGVMSGKIMVNAPAESSAAMWNGLNGEVVFNIVDTQFRGWDIKAIEKDLEKRKLSEGLAAFIKQKLESGVSQFKKVDGGFYLKNGNFEAKKVMFTADDFNIRMNSDGSLEDWENRSRFDVKINKPKSWPAFGFSWSGSIAEPVLEVDVKPLTDVYDAEQNKIAEAKRAEEQAVTDALKKRMDKQLQTLKIFEGNLYKINRDYEKFAKQAKKATVIENYQEMKLERDEIKRLMAEVSTIAMTPKFDENTIKQAEDKLADVIKRLNTFRSRVHQLHTEDLKFQIGENYDRAAEVKTQAQNNTQGYRDKASEIKKRLRKVRTDYVPEEDETVKRLSQNVENLLGNIVDVNEQLAQSYLKMNETDNVAKLTEYVENTAQLLGKMEVDLQKLGQDVDAYMKYTESKVGGEEERFSKAKREAEVKRKVAENIGKISIKEDGKNLTRTVVRNIEDIEKSEAVLKKEPVKVLDFSTKEKEPAAPEEKEPQIEKSAEKQEGSFLKKISGSVGKASGIIRKK